MEKPITYATPERRRLIAVLRANPATVWQGAELDENIRRVEAEDANRQPTKSP